MKWSLICIKQKREEVGDVVREREMWIKCNAKIANRDTRSEKKVGEDELLDGCTE